MSGSALRPEQILMAVTRLIRLKVSSLFTLIFVMFPPCWLIEILQDQNVWKAVSTSHVQFTEKLLRCVFNYSRLKNMMSCFASAVTVLASDPGYTTQLLWNPEVLFSMRTRQLWYNLCEEVIFGFRVAFKMSPKLLLEQGTELWNIISGLAAAQPMKENSYRGMCTNRVSLLISVQETLGKIAAVMCSKIQDFRRMWGSEFKSLETELGWGCCCRFASFILTHTHGRCRGTSV